MHFNVSDGDILHNQLHTQACKLRQFIWDTSSPRFWF